MNLKELILSSRAELAHFNSRHYPDAFSSFLAALTPLLTEPEDRPDQLIDALSDEWEGLRRKESKNLSWDIKLVLTYYFSPAALRIGGEAAEYAEALCEEWNRRFPRNRYQTGDYESIVSGFDQTILGIPIRFLKR